MWKEYLGGGDGVLVLVNQAALVDRLRAVAQSRQLTLRSKTVAYGDFSKISYQPTVRGESGLPYGQFFIAPDVLSVLETGDFLFNKAQTFEMEHEYRIIAASNCGIDFGWWRDMTKQIGAEYATMGALNHLRITDEKEYETAMAAPPPEGILLRVPLGDVIGAIVFKPGTSVDYINAVRLLLIDNGLGALCSKPRSEGED